MEIFSVATVPIVAPSSDLWGAMGQVMGVTCELEPQVLVVSAVNNNKPSTSGDVFDIV
jgi:hypothetical protein